MEAFEMIRVAVAEIDTNIVVSPPSELGRSYGSEFSVSGASDWGVVLRAGTLVEYAQRGPEALTICHLCAGPNAFDDWRACEQVRIVDALLGRPCTRYPKASDG
jgi:hypothetical protein